MLTVKIKKNVTSISLVGNKEKQKLQFEFEVASPEYDVCRPCGVLIAGLCFSMSSNSVRIRFFILFYFCCLISSTKTFLSAHLQS